MLSHGHTLLMILTVTRLLQPFMKKNCRRPAKQNSGLIKGLREKAIERLCVKLKGFDYSFNSWINKKV